HQGARYMAGALRKTMEYLGLAESDERYDDYDAYPEEPAEAHRGGAVRAVRDEDDDRPDQDAEVTPLPRRTPVSQVVREPKMSELNRITTIHPRTYNEAKDI